MLTLQELRTMKPAELKRELTEMQKELAHVRIGIRTKHVKDTAQSKKLRQAIARIKTLMKEIDLEEAVNNANKI